MNPVERLREFYDIGSTYLGRGLEADEQGRHEDALQCYVRGLEVLTEAQGVQVPPSQRENAQAIRQQVERNIANFRERCHTLQVVIRDSTQKLQRTNSGGRGTMLGRFFGSKPKPQPASTPPPQDSQLRHLRYSFEVPIAPQADPTGKKRPAAATPPAGTTGARPRRASSSLGRPASAPTRGGAPKARGKTSTVPGRTRPAGYATTPGTGGGSGLVKRLEKSGVDSKLVSVIEGTVITRENMKTNWDDVTGLARAKQALYEAAILPLQRPDLFTGLRSPARGILLFGPPGTGKTFLAKAVASCCDATFFNISASSLTSKFVGEGEKLVKALFTCACELQPSIVFVDEVDSLLSSRGDGENEASRRLKTEFMVQMEGLNSDAEGVNVVVIAATNRPYELDDAILRRFPKRLHIPLPDPETREALLTHLLRPPECKLSAADLRALARKTDGYSGSDITQCARETLMLPIRELGMAAVDVPSENIRAVRKADFERAMQGVKPTVSQQLLRTLAQWNTDYGST